MCQGAMDGYRPVQPDIALLEGEVNMMNLVIDAFMLKSLPIHCTKRMTGGLMSESVVNYASDNLPTH